jgi:hypothetical protein
MIMEAALVKTTSMQIRTTPVISFRWNDHSDTGSHFL